jgi:hypothetical protein
MNEDNHTLIAFLATLGAIVLLFVSACVCLAFGKSVEAIGIGGVMTGLIGVLGTFRPKSGATATTTTGDVTVNKEGQQ